MTKRELLDALEKWPDDAEVRVRAACCNHGHEIQAVREPTDMERDDGAQVTIDANE